MFRWLGQNDQRAQGVQAFSSISECLPKLYRERLLPIETQYGFHSCYSPPLTDADFVSRPMVLLIGQYSAGKSTFVRHLLGRDYPGLRIGPEPTTDKFVAVAYGESDQVIPGNAAVVDSSMPFTQLSNLGNAFLSRFEVSKMKSATLEGITLIDSPGVLSGEKQRVNRGYVFENVVKWFCERVDMVLILFDVSKLDISDEFKRVLLSTKGNDSKVHILLNKADRCTTSQLMRVYGALMWNLGKVMDTPEVARVYVGSFWDEPLQNDELRGLFQREEHDLYTHLSQLPRGASVRKMNDLIKRARLARVHAYLLETLRASLPLIGKTKKQAELLENLPGVYQECAKNNGIALGDFPDPVMMKQKLSGMQFKNFPRLDKKMIQPLEHMLAIEAPKLIAAIPVEASMTTEAQILNVGKGGVFGGAGDDVTKPDPEKYREEFLSLKPRNGVLSASDLKEKFEESGLPNTTLHRVWTMAVKAKLEDAQPDPDSMDLWQYAVAMQLIDMKKKSKDLPETLPQKLLPTKADIAAMMA